MMTYEKSKPKNTPAAVRRFQAALFIWCVVMLLLACYPPLWIVPLYTHLTPFFYIGASLLWLPFGLRHIRRYGLRKMTILLIAGCVVGTMSQSTGFWNFYNQQRIEWSSETDTGIVKYTAWMSASCVPATFWLKSLEGLPVAVVVDSYRPGSGLCILF